MPQLHSDVDQMGASLVVRLDGELSARTAPQVRTILLKCLADRPDVLVVDLSRLTVRESFALSIFRAVARQAALWPGTPIAYCVPPAEMSGVFADLGRPAVFTTVEQALAAKPRQSLPSLGESLLPVAGATARARALAGEACERWELPQASPSARLIVGELATNAMVHAQTMFDVRLILGRRYLLIAVRDGSPAVPRIDFGERDEVATGRGLMLVEAAAARWGSVPAEGGKVVWAALSVRNRADNLGPIG
ncbi:ATP-binding protein [Actinoplanes sp. TRM 88003]|uniref:ATP-binding protein n=1 Tax=Paractinoplanes aksuensis TaxID=2939490 RepID=A0ABT1DLL7_9ACTN|nr:ATP-binding protein [Actinoplanes aksuensis]MCO8271715.1 ATP-binding protein [Actinoplanes aksuensis]